MEEEFKQLQIEDEEQRTIYACQGFVGEALEFFQLLPEEIQFHWIMLKVILLFKFVQFSEPHDADSFMFLVEFKKLQRKSSLLFANNIKGFRVP